METPIASIQITKREALAAYDGDVQKLADDLKCSRSAIYQWPDGPIPETRALQLRFVLKPLHAWGKQNEVAYANHG